MENKKFEDYGFRPSAVIAGLNRWYEVGDKRAPIRFANLDDESPVRYQFFYNNNKAIDDAIKYLRSMDIFYQPGMKWDDVKFKLNSKACLAEFGFCDARDAWPKVKVDPVPLNYTDLYDFTKQKKAFDQWKTELDREARGKEIRDYILKRVDMNGIKVPITFRTGAVEDLIAYLVALLMQERKNKELAEEIQGQYHERANGYLEKIDRLQKELDGWNCWYNNKEHYDT